MCISVSENGNVKSIGGDEGIPYLLPHRLPLSSPLSSALSSPSLFPLSLSPPCLHPLLLFLLFSLSLPPSSHRSRQSLAWGPESTLRESQSPLVVRDHSVHVYRCLLLFIWCLSLFVVVYMVFIVVVCMVFIIVVFIVHDVYCHYLLLFVGVRYFV